MAGDDGERRREQAAIDQEEAASRVRAAKEEQDVLARARAAAASGDPRTVAEAAADLHRHHALHEAKAGRIDVAERALRRAAGATQRALRLMRG